MTFLTNTVTQEQIDALLDNAETEEHIFWEKELVVSFKIFTGFTVSGRAACVDPKNFNLEVGRKLAREDAASKLWRYEGYLLQQKLHQQTQGLELAKIGYTAYGAVTDYKNYQGLPMPSWDELPEKIKEAWINAALTIAAQ